MAERKAPGIDPVMRAIRLHAPGDPARLVAEQLPTPQPDAGEALVRVHAAGVHQGDWHFMTGLP